jgi:hypothetical protein
VGFEVLSFRRTDRAAANSTARHSKHNHSDRNGSAWKPNLWEVELCAITNGRPLRSRIRTISPA